MGDNPKSLPCMLHDLQINLMSTFSTPYPGVQPLRAVSAVDPTWAEHYLDYTLRYSAKTYSEKRTSFRRLLRAFGSETPAETLKPGLC